jgi:hypothetical protein
MLTNLHVLLILCAPPCPPEAGILVETGWRAYRADSIAVAAERFARADRMCEDNLDAKVGLGFARLRQNNVAAADSLFSLVTGRDSLNADGWDGLTLSRWRLGDRQAALAAAHRAIRLNPKNEATRDILTRLEPDWDRPPVPEPARAATLRIDARTHGDYFEIPAPGGSWQRFYVNGVNMGVALPGKFPSEFPPDSTTYARWLELIAGMHANTLRLYTILPPSFYRALRGWNTRHPDRLLHLIHGVWTELPPEHDFNDPEWKEQFRAEMRRVVDLLHGSAEIPSRPGHAGGRYDADVSEWVLGYIIGREWEPFAVIDFENRFGSTKASYSGRFLEVAEGLHIDAWMAEQCDYLLGYEVDRFNAIRPIAYTNWPTLDPLYHITETTAKEELAWRQVVGGPVENPSKEYDNDAIGVDAMLVRPTAANPAGWFASYHAYPYYPDFILYDPGYDTARSKEGRSNYFGYLSDLKHHHAGVPLLLSEYGVPSSRGDAHQQPQGFDHGGHDEVAMARIDARLTREIRESGAAGGIIFAWLDEWFKKNWIVIDYEIPLENTRQWHNMMDAEQNYGIIGLYAGERAATPILGGDASRWQALPVVQQSERAKAPLRRLRAGWDESYLYLALEIPGLKGGPFPPGVTVQIALDTWRPDLGQHTLPLSGIRSEVGFEFLATFPDTVNAELRIVPGYSPYAGGNAIDSLGDDHGRFANRPIRIPSLEDGRFDSMFAITNRARFTREGRFIGARGLNRGRLRFGPQQRSTLSDWYWDGREQMLEVRLPWNLLNVSDPSTRTLLYEETAGAEIGTVHAKDWHFGTVLLRRPRTGPPRVLSLLPEPDREGRWQARAFTGWKWSGWETPRYHQRLKPVYDSLADVWGGRW